MAKKKKTEKEIVAEQAIKKAVDILAKRIAKRVEACLDLETLDECLKIAIEDGIIQATGAVEEPDWWPEEEEDW